MKYDVHILKKNNVYVFVFSRNIQAVANISQMVIPNIGMEAPSQI